MKPSRNSRYLLRNQYLPYYQKEAKAGPGAERLRGEMATFDIKAKSKVIVEEGRRITARHIRELEKAGIKTLEVPDDYLFGKILANNIVDTETGELIASANDES